MGALHFGDARRAGQHANKLHPRRTGGFHDRDGFGRAVAGGQHWIQDQHFGLGQVGRQTGIILDWSQCHGIALQADVPGARFGQEWQHALLQSEASAQDGDERDVARKDRAREGGERTLHRCGLRFPTPRCLDEQKERHLLHGSPEFVRRGRLGAQDGELGRGQRMIEEMQLVAR